MKKDYERDKPEVKKRFERKRFLNVIYFIDSNRTRTLKFSIGTSYVTVGLLSAAVVWSVIATSLLIRDHFIFEGMRKHSTSLLQTVFNYQTRYDEVYEKAYPTTDASLLTADKDREKEKEKDKPRTEAKAAAIMALSAAALDKSPAALAANAPATPKEKAVSQAKANNEPPIAIDNFSSNLTQKNLTIRLALKNLSTATKASGSVRAKATFVDSENKSYTLESHPTKTRDDNGNDEHFNIRYFKNKAFYFDPPQGVTGRFTDVTVTITGDDGRSKDFPYPMDKLMKVRETEPAVSTQSAPIVKADKVTEPEDETEKAPEVKAKTEATPDSENAAEPAPAESTGVPAN